MKHTEKRGCEEADRVQARRDPFEIIAPFYDWEHGDFDEDLPMYLALARRHGGPVLEPACGTGRLVLPLAREGFDVVGFDRSGAMLRVARAKLSQAELTGRVRLEQTDMGRYSRPERFGLVIFALDALGLLLDSEAQIAALALARAHLRPGGRVVVDVQNGNARGGEPREELVHQLTRPNRTTGRLITKWTARRTEVADQFDDLTYLYDELSPDGRVHRTIAELRVRYFFRYELELLLRQAKLTVESLSGSYQLDPYDEGSERLIVVAAPAG